MPELHVARSELILGGEPGGKTARAEALAAAWLEQSGEHRAVFVATAQGWDDTMRERIARHQRYGLDHAPRMRTVEEPLELAHAIGRHSRADTLVVADCLTLGLTALSMGEGITCIAEALHACAGPIVLISNEFGPHALPRGRDAQAFIDSLGGLNREAAAACERVTLVSGGMALVLKGSP